MQQELIGMLEKVVDHVVFCNGHDQRFSSTSCGVNILKEAGELIEKAKNNAPAVPDTHISVQEAWEAAGGNPGIKASKADLIIALKTLDTVCDEADAAPAVPQGEPVAYLWKCRKKPELREVSFKKHNLALESIGYKATPLYATPAPAPAQEVGLIARQFDLICQAIDKADTITMEGDYMLDSDDCISVVRVMQALFDIEALRAKENKL